MIPCSTRVISRHQDLQIYGAILPAELTNQDMLYSKAYKEYYVVASGAESPKAKTKYKKKVDESLTSPKSKTSSASKAKVALSKVEQVKLVAKRSKTDFYISQAGGSGDGVDTQSKGVPDVPPYESESDKESWGDSDDEDDDNDDDGDNDDDVESNDHDDESDNERTESDSEEIPDPNLTKEDQTEYEEEDVVEGFKQEEDAHVTLTPVSNAQKADEHVQSSYVSYDFTSKVSALETEVSELKQTNQFVEAVSLIPSIVDQYLASKMKEAVNVNIQLQTNKLREETQTENQYFFNQDEMIKTRMKTPPLDQTDRQREGNLVKMLHPLNIQECSKAIAERLDWHNPENKPYPFNLRKPFSLIQDHRGRQIIPKDYFINKDLEYLKGRDSSRRYSISVMKTTTATYELKWIEDLVTELWSLVMNGISANEEMEQLGQEKGSGYGLRDIHTALSEEVEFRRISLTGFRSRASRSQTEASQSRQST
nr:hypothetical protein [Tanacetum cinerariifolium]